MYPISILLLLSLLLYPFQETAIKPSEIIGFAMVNGATTGGKNGPVVQVSTLAELRRAATSSFPMTIRFSGNIRGEGFISVKSDKTIIGGTGSSMEGIGLLIYGHHNVIIRNMTIRNVRSYSNIVIKEGAHHVWIDHCTLSSDRDHGWDYYDGLLDVGNRADYVTLSWNKLHDNHKAMLIGFGDQNTNDSGRLRVTIYKNYFYNNSERQPRVRFGQVHVFNNYIKNSSGYGIGSSMEAMVRTDNNYFENTVNPIKTDFNTKSGYISGSNSNFYKNSRKNIINTSVDPWKPSYPYTSQLLPANKVPVEVGHSAGAK